MSDTDDLPDHLKMIQDIIDRLSRNSFLLKGWSVTLASAVFVLATKGVPVHFALLAGLLPTITFWGLDAYFLAEERVFRNLYDSARRGDCSGDGRFSLTAKHLRGGFGEWFDALITGSTLGFHAAVIGTVIIGLGWFGR